MSLVSRWLLYRGLSLIAVVFMVPDSSEILNNENLASSSSPRFMSKHWFIRSGLPPSIFQNSLSASSFCCGNTIEGCVSLVLHLLIFSHNSKLTFFLSSLQSLPTQKYILFFASRMKTSPSFKLDELGSALKTFGFVSPTKCSRTGGGWRAGSSSGLTASMFCSISSLCAAAPSAPSFTITLVISFLTVSTLFSYSSNSADNKASWII